VALFKYLRTTVPNQNLIQEEIKRRMNSGIASYNSVQKFLSSRLISKNLKIKIYRTIISPAVLNGCETWSLTLRDEHKRRVFEKRVFRRIFGPMTDEVTRGLRTLRIEELYKLYSSPSIPNMSKLRRIG
jgi:hypothetical protein